MSRQIKSFYEATRYLGQYMDKVGDGFLKLTSCMGMERRQQIAVLEWLKEISDKIPDLDKLSHKEALDQIIIPLLSKLGFAEWPRDTVTDMAIRKGITKGKAWNLDTEEKEE